MLMIIFCSAITRQIEHKLLKRGFQFNVMVVGSLCAPSSDGGSRSAISNGYCSILESG